VTHTIAIGPGAQAGTGSWNTDHAVSVLVPLSVNKEMVCVTVCVCIKLTVPLLHVLSRSDSLIRHIVSNFSLQRIRLYNGATMVKEWKMRSGKAGIGTKPEVSASPSEKFRVSMKIRKGQPIGIFEKLTPQGRIAKTNDPHAFLTSRLLVLEGLDPANKNTRSRGYLHPRHQPYSGLASAGHMVAFAWTRLRSSIRNCSIWSRSVWNTSPCPTMHGRTKLLDKPNPKTHTGADPVSSKKVFGRSLKLEAAVRRGLASDKPVGSVRLHLQPAACDTM
jgi:hypothetical protein